MADQAEGDTTGNRTPSTPVAEPTDRPQVEIGEIIDERYKISSFLGEGGMAMVFQIERMFFKDVCAMKVGKHSLTQVSGRRFQKEAMAACSLDHPNLLRVYDFGIVREQYPYFVMDYVDGKTLQRFIKHNGPLDVPLAMHIFSQVCDGMAQAHRKGIVHRDLKPSNIMLTEGTAAMPQVKVVDFGLVKLLENASEQGLTQPGDIFGSPLYMSPEQCSGTVVDHRSDIYSFGCTLFEALTGKTPFRGETALDTMLGHRNETPPTLEEASGGKQFSTELEDLVARLLAKEPDDRPDSFEDVSELLKSACANPATPDGDKPTHPAATTGARLSKPMIASIAAVAILLVCGAVVCLKVLDLLTPPSENDSPRVTLKSPPLKDSEQLPGVPDLNDMLNEPDVRNVPGERNVPDEVVTSKKYSSVVKTANGVKQVVFTFPPSMKLGKLYIVHSAGQRSTSWPAEGTVTVPYGQSLGLKASGDSIRNFSLLKSFRKEDLSELLLPRMFVKDSIVDNIDHLSDLKRLEFELSDLTDRSLPRIDAAFPRLEWLSFASSSDLTGQGISKMSILPKLHFFKIGGIPDSGIILRSLIASAKNTHHSNLDYLSAPDSGLKDEDLENIEALTELHTLFIRKNPELTDEAIRHIARCKNLGEVDLQEAQISPSCGPLLAKSKSLRKVAITTTGWTLEQKRAVNTSTRGIVVTMNDR